MNTVLMGGKEDTISLPFAPWESRVSWAGYWLEVPYIHWDEEEGIGVCKLDAVKENIISNWKLTFIFSARAAHFTPLCLLLHSAHISILSLSAYGGFSKPSLIFFHFPPCYSSRIYLFYTVHNENSIPNLNSRNSTSKRHNQYPPLPICTFTIGVQATIFSYLDQHSNLLINLVTLTFAPPSYPAERARIILLNNTSACSLFSNVAMTSHYS